MKEGPHSAHSILLAHVRFYPFSCEPPSKRIQAKTMQKHKYAVATDTPQHSMLVSIKMKATDVWDQQWDCDSTLPMARLVPLVLGYCAALSPIMKSEQECPHNRCRLLSPYACVTNIIHHLENNCSLLLEVSAAVRTPECEINGSLGGKMTKLRWYLHGQIHQHYLQDYVPNLCSRVEMSVVNTAFQFSCLSHKT